MTDFWFNHFNVYWDKGADRWLTTDFEVHAIRPNTLGKFKDLLLATAQSPAMLFYLDNHLRVFRIRGSKQRNRPNNPRIAEAGINENYARELMELHAGADGGYVRKTSRKSPRADGWTRSAAKQRNFIFRPRCTTGREGVLGHRIPANGGMQDGRVIDIPAAPSTARFISTSLSAASATSAAVARGQSRRLTKPMGHPAMMRLFSSPKNSCSEAYGQKMKTPRSTSSRLGAW
jgi:uncharacterized protein (DUF1800 family)